MFRGRKEDKVKKCCSLQALAERYKGRCSLATPFSTMMKFMMSPKGFMQCALKKACLRLAISRIDLYGGYRMVPVSNLDEKQKQESEKLLHECRGYIPCAGRDGVAVLIGERVIGTWEFEKVKDAVHLIAVSSIPIFHGDFAWKNHCAIKHAMFHAIIEFCRITECEKIAYFRKNATFEAMMRRFKRDGLISSPEKNKEGTMHQVLPDEWY